jgi:dTDP-glucose pyrophosphorylase
MENFKKSVVSLNIKIKEAILTLENSHTKIVLVVDENYKLIGTISDGDIRRGVLKGLTIESPIKDILHTNFISVQDDKTNKEIMEIMTKNEISQIPIIDKSGKLIGLHLLNEFVGKSEIENNIVIMAGGRGVRLRPLTEDCPKPMLKIGDKPLLEIIINQFIENGFKNFHISVNYLKEQIIDYFQDGSKWGININYLIEDEPLGTAGSLIKLPKSLNKPYFVVNGDVLSRFNPMQVLEFHNKNESDMTICAHTYDQTIPYGVIETKGDGMKFERILEKPTFQHLVNAGVYVIDPKINLLISRNSYLDMPDLITLCTSNNKNIIIFPIHEYWLDIGRHENLKEARNNF